MIEKIGNSRLEVKLKKSTRSKRTQYILQGPPTIISEWYHLLTSAATTASIMDVVHQGWLDKQGEANKGKWNNRYFILRSGILYYYHCKVSQLLKMNAYYKNRSRKISKNLK